jgi:signal transduction histidine kinase
MLAISNIYLGNSDKAVYYIQQCQNLEASRFKKNLQVKTVEIGTKYETETEKIKITSLKTEKRLYLWIVIISIAAAALTSVLLYLRKKHKKQIENAQSVLKNETAMRERLADKLKDETVQREYIANKLKDETVKRVRLFEFSQLVLKDETVERVRLSRKLNDDIGNRLTVIKLNLTNTNSHAMVENSFTNSFDTTLKLLDESIDELWRVSSNIMPDLSAGLKTPLEDLCMGIPEVKFWFFGDDSHLDNNLRIIIFRCVSELITCGLKNAHKTDLKIQLSVDKEFVLLSAQSGGYSSENLTESEELKDILKRIVIYNGELNVYSSEIEDAKTEPETEITITIEQL